VIIDLHPLILPLIEVHYLQNPGQAHNPDFCTERGSEKSEYGRQVMLEAVKSVKIHYINRYKSLKPIYLLKLIHSILIVLSISESLT
jgi:hypothetical protein